MTTLRREDAWQRRGATAAGGLMKQIAIPLALTLFVVPTIAASVDCSTASSFVAKEICTNPQLRKLDAALEQNFAGMLASDLGRPEKALRAEQERWASKRKRCTSTRCLITVYRKRLDETCGYGVVTGVHPLCTLSEDIP